MKNKGKTILIISMIPILITFILLIIVVFGSIDFPYNANSANTDTIVQIDTVYEIDTITNETVIYKPDGVKIIFDTLYIEKDFDTTTIILDYFSKKIYLDSIIDSLVKIYIHDTIYKNAIDARYITYELQSKTKTIYNNKTVYVYPSRYFSLGITGYYSNKNLNTYGNDLFFSGYYTHNFKTSLGLSYSPFSNTIQIHYLYNFKRNKNKNSLLEKIKLINHLTNKN